MSLLPKPVLRRRPARRRLLAVVVAGLLALTAAACGSDASSGGTAKDQVKVGFFPAVIYFSDAVAQEKGFFDDEDLDVEFVTPQDGPTLFRLVIAGNDINMTITDSGAPISYRSQGQDVSVIGSVLNKSPWEIYVPTDATWADPDASYEDKLRSLRGKTIGVPGLGTAGYLVLSAALRGVGIDPEKDVTIISVVGLPAVATQFGKGSIDAYVYQLPFGGLLEAEGAGRTYIQMATDGPDTIADVVSGAVMASSRWLKDNEDVASRYLAAEQKAVAWISDPANAEEAADIFNDSFLSGKQPDLAAEIVAQISTDWYAATDPDLAVPEGALEHSIALLQDSGQLEGEVDYGSLVADVSEGS